MPGTFSNAIKISGEGQNLQALVEDIKKFSETDKLLFENLLPGVRNWEEVLEVPFREVVFF